MENKIIHFETLGCRLNQDESEGAARAFRQNGFTVDMEAASASSEKNSSVILSIVNTCTVTGKAEQKARRIIRLLLEKFPESKIIVTGCYAELDGNLIESICPERIVALKGTQKFMLSLIASELSSGTSLYDEGIVSVPALRDFISSGAEKNGSSSQKIFNAFSLFTPVFEKHSRGSIKVQDGCNCACSFCRIHLARGKSVSLDADDVVSRVKEIERSGINEVVFTGVNLSQYSSLDSYGKSVDFSRLLQMVIDATEKISLRISSFYPQSIDSGLCAVLSDPRIQPFFHMSIQSGSDRILELMRRPHSVSHVEKSIELIRKAKENPFISCDMIAGFPGETDADFAMTMKLCNEQNFAWIHAFPFSPRQGTPAMHMKGQVEERVKTERVKQLTEKAVQGKISYVDYWKERTVSAVVENSRAIRKSIASPVIHAVTENYLHVECPSPSFPCRPGDKISVVIKEACPESISSGKEIDCTGIVVH